jgi:glycosyltransferase AglE
VSTPFASVILPVFNNKEGLARALNAIANQTYPRDHFEIIVVDNGSYKSPRDVAEKYNAIYLEEHNNLNSPYSARNRGIEIAKGDIIALLDTTCTPIESWLSSGISAIVAGADLVGGDVIFNINPSSSVGEIYDSLFNIQMKSSILKRGVAKTTNLFISKRVFSSIGYFPEGLRSGGDVSWSHLASRSGFKLVFSGNAKVYIMPRGFQSVIKKQWRVAKGQPLIWLKTGSFNTYFLKKCLLCFVPPYPLVYFKGQPNGMRISIAKLTAVYVLGYFIRILTGIAILVGSFTALK